MGLNISVIILGGIIVSVALFLFIREQRSTVDEFPDTLPFQGANQQELLHLRREVKELKDGLAEVTALLQDLTREPGAEAAAAVTTTADEPFDQLLNYNRFAKKNQRIIEMYQSGKSPEDIARNLGKSIREVEMVIKLIK